jgi:hypothetical protein
MKRLTAERLREVLHYDPATGIFTRLIASNDVKIGDQAGTRNSVGRIKIMVDSKVYKAHRLAWLYAHGAWPQKEIDHKNRNPNDNRLANLREASHGQNIANSIISRRSGLKGAYADGARWRASIRKDKKSFHLGQFATAELAHAAYCKAAAEMHGEFARTSNGAKPGYADQFSALDELEAAL